MDTTARQRTQQYISARRQHPAWLLLASPRAPLVLGCLTSLFEFADNGISEEDALQALADMLAEYAAQDEFDIDPDNTRQLAGRELRQWIKRGLVVERGGRIYASDALSSAIAFIDALDNRIMTTTASRLSVVQREIENLEVGLNPNPDSRKAAIRRQIKALEAELAEAEAGYIPVLSEAEAIERIREVYNLATGLRADFRRVEDSWREADRALRQSIISEQFHRGDIVDRLLDGQASLLNTPEGRVFDGFQQQLRQSVELDNMRERIRTILSHSSAAKALNRAQLIDLKLLRVRLVSESQSVLRARARSEKDVKGFLKTGLAAEHHRVGQLLNDILHQAQELDWQQQKVRRADSPLPPVGMALGNIPVPERLRFKSLQSDGESELDLSEQETAFGEIEDEFWEALDGLDREAAVRDTLDTLSRAGRPLTLAELAEQLPPVHDLETLALWLGMAREAGIAIADDELQRIALTDSAQQRWQFCVPRVALSSEALDGVDWEF
ncbi:DUF3375 domain-containing protein [Microbulbifer bruguierae]|uniref:DUF3375 domain-containing protein n=1 Tax=Microbulbifer bruguierae TaxID=3029061 RepID=A0ABY8NEC3_9GAMM|nr:DUF3375 domain-containing protein [Microbulbifer bruguierae]WGL15813.1 DUF3375 domain-containing protein [Microbulbifer bruguierae]